jgi:hypothetical protein
MRIAALLSLSLCLAVPALALDPLPTVHQGPGYTNWTLEADRPLLKLETVLHDLRSPDRRSYEKVVRDLGIQKLSTGRGLAFPEFVQPIAASAQFLGFERRKMAILSLPLRGKHRWYAVLLRQEGNGEAYWRARQVFAFDTDPVEGYSQSFPDINGEDIHFWMVRHLAKENIYGRGRVDSVFKWDERGRLRLTWQEIADAFRPARFQGQAQRLQHELTFKGDQVIRRKLLVKTYPWMKREEWEQYKAVDAPEVPAAKVLTVEESFAWDPADFNFYGLQQELDKLEKHKSPWVRREAARRLGEHLKSTHPVLETALLSDKDAYVRIQSALAIEAIADPAALPAVEKALVNWDEPDEVREALERAKGRLEAALAAQPTPVPEPVKEKPKKKPAAKAKSGQEPAVQAITQPKLNDAK